MQSRCTCSEIIEVKDVVVPLDPHLGSRSEMVVIGEQGHDSRKWNYFHYHAVYKPDVMHAYRIPLPAPFQTPPLTTRGGVWWTNLPENTIMVYG